ncbi:uncharacterized protein ASCRUDRAFT_8752 [Ascoidea rubescens DSM 1968]|uniref:Uncharacterized protein n=1 Tax=Ascoidea rubescens DSM 1968 TaxID=1344418 RepID=A0A1D2VFW4_9ASCO|nr:hypothetical protein ASCRUDRAFT_8752 [Ascoidea rubescens DSM 1968]ODV60551.1 hypothetical protein ASCRUDRAFT_8752 [Ascoidea rubescens DSM 1968]
MRLDRENDEQYFCSSPKLENFGVMTCRTFSVEVPQNKRANSVSTMSYVLLIDQHSNQHPEDVEKCLLVMRIMNNTPRTVDRRRAKCDNNSGNVLNIDPTNLKHFNDTSIIDHF